MPEISYNPLKELLFNAKYVNGGGWEIGLTFCCLKSEARCGQTQSVPPMRLAIAPTEVLKLYGGIRIQ